MAKWWQEMQGCNGEPRTTFTDQTLECAVYCDASPAAAERRPMINKKAVLLRRPSWKTEATKQAALRAPVLKLCGMKGVGHDLNTPYNGYAFDVAW